MVKSIVKQSIDIRLKITPPPKVTSSSEICVLCGMLSKIFDLKIPSVNTTGELKEFILSHVNNGRSERADKLIELLSESQKESEQIIDEWKDVIKYGYNME